VNSRKFILTRPAKNESSVRVFFVPKQCELLIIGPGKANIQIVIPGNESLVTDGSQTCAGRQKICKAVFFAEIGKLGKYSRELQLQFS
jgi:hypothetical protein